MTFIDRIADARDIADVFDLVNEFIVGLHHVHQLQEIPVALRPGRVATADDLAFWLNLLSEDKAERCDRRRNPRCDVRLARGTGNGAAEASQ